MQAGGKRSAAGRAARAVVLAVPCLLGACAGPVDARVGTSWDSLYVVYDFRPARPRAGETMWVDIDITRGEGGPPLDLGPLAATVEREAAFSRIVPLARVPSLPGDPARPGHYVLPLTPPHAGLYRLALRSPRMPAPPQRLLEFPVWGRGRNPHALGPLLMFAAALACAVWWTRRGRGGRSPA